MTVTFSFRLSVREGRSYLGKLGIKTADEVSEPASFLEANRALVLHVDGFQKSFFVWPTTNINSTSVKRLLPGLLKTLSVWEPQTGENCVDILGKSDWFTRKARPHPGLTAREQGMPCLLGKMTTSSTAAGEAWKETEMQMTQYLFHSFPWEGIYYFCYFSLCWFSKCSKLYNEHWFMPV